MSDTTRQKGGAAQPGFFTTATLRKAVAFVVRVARLGFRSAFAPDVAARTTMGHIMRATAVKGARLCRKAEPRRGRRLPTGPPTAPPTEPRSDD